MTEWGACQPQAAVMAIVGWIPVYNCGYDGMGERPVTDCGYEIAGWIPATNRGYDEKYSSPY